MQSRYGTIARLFAHDATGILIEDDYADAKPEVLEVLVHTEEVTCEVVVQHKVIHLRLHLCGGKLRVIDKSTAIADFSIEHLASAHCLVRLDEINDVVRHLIVASPWDVLHLVVDDDWCDVMRFLEDFGSLGGEGCGGVGIRDGMDGCKCKCIGHNMLFLRQRYEPIKGLEKTIIYERYSTCLQNFRKKSN